MFICKKFGAHNYQWDLLSRSICSDASKIVLTFVFGNYQTFSCQSCDLSLFFLIFLEALEPKQLELEGLFFFYSLLEHYPSKRILKLHCWLRDSGDIQQCVVRCGGDNEGRVCYKKNTFSILGLPSVQFKIPHYPLILSTEKMSCMYLLPANAYKDH